MYFKMLLVMRACLVVIFFLSVYIPLHAISIDTSQLRIQYQKALEWNEQKDLERAFQMARQTLIDLESIKNPALDLEVGLSNILGDCALESGQYSEALQRYENSHALLEQKGRKDGLLMAEVLNKLGNYHREIKSFEKAEEYLKQALDIRKKRLGNWDLRVADIYINLGNCMNYIGDFDKALDFHQQALAIRTDLLPENHPQIAQCYNNIGLSLDDKQDYQESLKAYRQALKGYIEAYGKDHQDIADVYINMGNTYGDLEKIDTFIYFQRLALDIWLNIHPDNHPLIALAYNNLANAYDELGDTQKAFQLYRKALAIRINKYGFVHPDVAVIYFNMGLSYSWVENWPEALEAFKQCFTALNYQPDHHPNFEHVNDPILLLSLLEVIPEIPVNAFRESGTIGYLLEASSYYEQADLLIDFLRTRYEAVGSKLILANTAQDIYDSAIEIALVLGQLTKDENYLRQAFQFSEKSKGILLLESLKKADAQSFSGIPGATIEELNRKEARIGELEKQRFLEWGNNSTSNTSRIDSLNNLIFQQKEALASLIETIEQKYPQYFNLRYATSTIPIDWLQQQLLQPNQTIIEYFLGEEYLRIFIINKNDFTTQSVKLGPEFRQSLEAFNFSIRSFLFVSSKDLPKLIQQYAFSANYLYDHLIKPIKDHLKEKLIIIPDEELGFISFEALLSSLPDQLNSFKTYPYLVRDYTISYNYSTGLLKEMIEHTHNSRLKDYLGFAPEFQDGNVKGLNQLKYNFEEIQGTRQKMGGRILSNQEATKGNFLKHQGNYKIIHLATHGKANNVSGDYSFLAFSETEDSKGDEALLYVREIYNLSTHAEMVVLSACETGTGELQKGEGIASIARSFSYAGAKSLVASQWSVDDKATSKLMHLFFENIKNGDSKDVALQQAKLSFIQSSSQKEVHPFFWASFVTIGNIEPLSFPSSFIWLAWLIPALLILFGLYFWLKS